MSAKNDAKRMLKHYLRLAAKAAGVKWDSDNDAEAEDIVELIIRAVREEMEAPDDGSYAEYIHRYGKRGE